MERRVLPPLPSFSSGTMGRREGPFCDSRMSAPHPDPLPTGTWGEGKTQRRCLARPLHSTAFSSAWVRIVLNETQSPMDVRLAGGTVTVALPGQFGALDSQLYRRWRRMDDNLGGGKGSRWNDHRLNRPRFAACRVNREVKYYDGLFRPTQHRVDNWQVRESSISFAHAAPLDTDLRRPAVACLAGLFVVEETRTSCRRLSEMRIRSSRHS